jgi:hypothetical protein
MDFLRERELRETLEKQLAMEQKNRGISEIPMKFNTITKMVNIIIYVMVSYLL